MRKGQNPVSAGKAVKKPDRSGSGLMAERMLFGEQGSGVIPVAAVGQEGHNNLPFVFRTLCQLDGAEQGRAGGDADGDAFLPCQELRGVKGVLAGSPEDLVVDPGVQDLRNEAGADTLDLVGARTAFGKNGGIIRLEGDDSDGRVLLLEVFASCPGSLSQVPPPWRSRLSCPLRLR